VISYAHYEYSQVPHSSKQQAYEEYFKAQLEQDFFSEHVLKEY